MRVIEDSKESWAIIPAGDSYQVVIRRLDGGVELHSNPVLVKLAEDKLIRVEPMTLTASIMKSSLRKALKLGVYDSLLWEAITYLVVNDESSLAKAKLSYTRWLDSVQAGNRRILPRFYITKLNSYSYGGRSGIAETM